MQIHSTTIICVKRNKMVAMAGDGQVSVNHTILKNNACKVRRIYNDSIVTGFAGATADAFTLLERLEVKLQENNGNLTRASVELAKDWRSDKILRRLEALLLASDGKRIFLITGNGDVIEPNENIIAIGSGGNYALSTAKGLIRHTKLSAAEIAESSLKIAAEICVYTNTHITLEEISE